MQRMITLLLCGLMLLSMAACGRTQPEETPSYDLYFMEADLKEATGRGALRAETAYLPELEGADPEETAKGLMEALLQGPLDGTLTSPIPVGTNLLSLKLEGGRAVVDLTASYGSLSGVGLTLADYAVALTLTQVPEIGSVKITVRGQELAYRDRQIFLSRDVLLVPEEDVVSTVTAVLYFLNGEGALTPEERTLDLYEGDTQVYAVARALENGPESKELSAVMPEGFRVKSVWLEEDVCYMNLSSAMLEGLPQKTELQTAVYSLAKSLCSLDTVSEVRFLVDGEFAKQYGTVDISEPYIFVDQ